jgi:glutaredoxin
MNLFEKYINKFNSSSDDTFTIFSKKDCQWCTSALEFLEEELNSSGINYFDCTEILKENRDEFVTKINELSGTTVKTFPIIFQGKKYIGGFSELRKLFT